MVESIWILIVAAGHSTRMGSRKQLLNINGNSLIRHMANKALSVPQTHTLIVGNEDQEIRLQCSDLPVTWVENKHSQLGLSTSIVAGVRKAMEYKARAVVIILADQPDMLPQVIEQLIRVYQRSRGPIVQAQYTDRAGHPVLFDQTLFSELLQLEGDHGARSLLNHHRAEIQFVSVPFAMPCDLDTPEEYEAYRNATQINNE